MKQLLKENGGLPASILWTLSIVAGVTVANLYYNQPLLNMIRQEFHVSEVITNMIAMVTQIGYAIGLLFVIPLGDMFQRKTIIRINFFILILALLNIAWAPTIHWVLIASLFTGICSVMPQIFIPIASLYSKPENKGRNVGLVVSGLLTGILASRVISGIIGELFGWREMYLIAAGLMILCVIVISQVLPEIKPTFKGKYSELMQSLFSLLRAYPLLRIYSLRAGFSFGSFLALWSCLAFKMGQAPFFAGSDVVGLLGLCGIAGALSASFVGNYVTQVGVRRFNFIGSSLFFFSWMLLYFFGDSYPGIISGILLIDIGMQCIQLSNQSSIFGLCPTASNRINTLFMTTYFIGGSLGTFLTGFAWEVAEWSGVVGIGLSLAGISFLITLLSGK